MNHFNDEDGVDFTCKVCAGDINRNLSEVCCSNKSFMGLTTVESYGCNISRITIKEDFTTDFGLDMAISNIKGPQDGAWVCIPCTGGGKYNGPNYKNYEGARRKMLNHFILFRKMKRSLIKLLEHCWNIGAFLLIEWPKSCAYWNDPDIVVWIARFQLQFTEFHGCQFDLTSINPATFGELINKPWYGAVMNSQFIAKEMTQVCPGVVAGKHEHVQCQGVDTKRTEGYTVQLVAHFHKLFRKRALSILRTHCKHSIKHQMVPCSTFSCPHSNDVATACVEITSATNNESPSILPKVRKKKNQRRKDVAIPDKDDGVAEVGSSEDENSVLRDTSSASDHRPQDNTSHTAASAARVPVGYGQTHVSRAMSLPYNNTKHC